MNFDDPVYARMTRCIKHLEKLLEIASKECNAINKTTQIDNRKRWELLALKEANR